MRRPVGIQVQAATEDLDQALAATGLRGHLTPRDRSDKPRTTRSTKRRNDSPDLPRLPVDTRTIGRAYAGRHGETYRPSMLVSLSRARALRAAEGNRTLTVSLED